VNDVADDPPHGSTLDLDALQRELADVETALARLDAGTYWVDEVTGQPLPDALLATTPTARRMPSGADGLTR
jgi:RNA polymerase-binding transcription factor DksA